MVDKIIHFKSLFTIFLFYELASFATLALVALPTVIAEGSCKCTAAVLLPNTLTALLAHISFS